MASVYIDIPNIGTVEAKNAASESTLLALVKAINDQKKLKGSEGAPSKKSADDEKENLKAKKQSTGAFSKLAKGTGMVIGGMDRLSTALTGTIKQFAEVGDSVESAAGIFKDVPIIGGMFGAVATAVTKVTDSFQSAASSGATFGGSIQSFSRSASAAGMPLDKFGALIKSNGQGMLGFGNTVEGGAKQFSVISKQLRASSSELYALGYSTQEINSGLANYGALMRAQGRAGTMTNSQLVAGSRNYLKEMDALAKITGQTREEKEKEREALAADGMFRAAMAGLGPEVEASAAQMIQSLPTPELQAFAKDIIANGTATTASSQLLASQMPGLTAQFQQMHKQTQANNVISKEQQNQAMNIGKAEAGRSLRTAKAAFAASDELHSTAAALGAFGRVQDDAVKQTEKDQQKAKENSDGLNKQTEAAKARLSELSNTFQMALANSGILEVMIKAFEFLAGLVMTYVVPAFNILASIITNVGTYLIETLTPVFDTLAVIIKDYVWPALKLIGRAVNDYVITPFMYISEWIYDNLTPVLLGLGTTVALLTGHLVYAAVVNAAKNTYETIHNGLLVVRNALTLASNLGLAGLAAATWAAVAPILAIAAPFVIIAAIAAGLVYGFKKLYDAGWSLGSAFDAIVDNLKRFGLAYTDIWLSIAEKIAGFFGKGEGIKAARAKIAEEQKELDDREKLRDEKREQTAKERQDTKDKNALARENKKADDKTLELKGSHAAGLADVNKKEKDALEERMDYNSDPIALLGQELKKQKSGILPASPTTKTSEGLKSAEGGLRKSLEAAGEKKTAEAAGQVTTEEEAKKLAMANSAKKSAPTATQESAESLLASLNTKLDRLIQVSQRHVEIGTSQLSVQQSLSGDLLRAV